MMETLLQHDSIPEEIVVSKDRSTLAWCLGSARHVLSAERLRLSCRCAWCTRDRLVNSFPDAFEALQIGDVSAIGGHGLHITFSDGHARGIFPYRYLNKIASGEVTT